jgi:DNA-binding GntR family transcriptional regulator
MRIAECTQCRPLSDLLEKNQVLIFNWYFDVSAGYRLGTGRHRALMDVLNGDDPDAAALAMGAHIRAGLDEIQATIGERFQNALSNPRRTTASGEQPPTTSLPWRSRYNTLG